jgi:alpha-L-fucosidase
MQEMKRAVFHAALLAFTITSNLQAVFGQQAVKNYARMHWWRDARFGMFIHWGIYAIPAQGEWFMTNAHVPRAKYAQYAKEFSPTEFDADEWVKIAHDAGMRYLVITSKHHDGFCMFNTKATEYNVVDATPWKKDPLKALTAACRRYGVLFGVYYSIMDWHSPDQLANKEDTLSPMYNPTHFKPNQKQAYVDFMKTQLKELLTEYHPAILWFDGGWMNGWTAEDGEAIYRFLRGLDPKLIINDRVVGTGDYGTPEQHIPANGLPGQDWETCMTINNSWGYNSSDTNFKSTRELLHNLIDIASKGGNYLLNVGPTAKGVIPQVEIDRLEGMGRWLEINGESIYSTTAGPFTKQLPWGRCTQNLGKLYLQVFDWPKDGKLIVHGVYNKPKLAYLLADKARLPLRVGKAGDSLLVEVPSNPPDSICNVITLEFEGNAVVYNPPSLEFSTPIFVDTLNVDIKSTAEEGKVRYTLDGTVPTEKSDLATGTLRLTGTTTITAARFRDGHAVSELSRATLTKVLPRPSVEFQNIQNGVRYEYYRGNWDSLPDFSMLASVRNGKLNNFVLPPEKDLINYGVVYTSYLVVPQDGVYTFYTASDDGSKLYIGDSLIVDNDYQHGTVEKSGLIALAKGHHPIRVEFFQARGEDSLSVGYSSSSIKRHVISDGELHCEK